MNFSKNVSSMFDSHLNLKFWLQNKQTTRVLSLRDLRFVVCSRDLDILRAQRIIGFLNYPQVNEVGKFWSHVHVGSPHIPGHVGPKLQPVVSCVGPWQSSPPFCGGGLVQLRVLFITPFPHVTLHAPNGAHSVNPPFTTWWRVHLVFSSFFQQ